MLLCKDAIEREPDNSVHYLNLGRIYLLTHKKQEAITVFREGLTHETNEQIINELNNIVPRKSPLIPFLHRDNPINKYLGIFLGKLRLR